MQNKGIETLLRLRAVQSIPGECMDIMTLDTLWYIRHFMKPNRQQEPWTYAPCFPGQMYLRVSETQYVGALANQFARPPSVNKQVSVCKAFANR